MTRIGNGLAFLKDGNSMSVVVLVLLLATFVAVAAFLIAMFVKDQPLYGAFTLVLMGIPGIGLAFIYQVLAKG